jgi:signal transduction histidine kinase
MAAMQLTQIDLLHHIFPDLSHPEIQALQAAAQEQSYAPGDVLCREGEVGRRLFIISEGEAEIFVKADGDQLILVKKVFPTEYFGEMALINDAPRAATVRAITQCKTLEIDRDAFLEVVDTNPALLRAIVKQISDLLRNNDRIIIGELRQKNRALNVAYSNLSTQEKLRTDFIATLSHELRTPLTSAQGFLHLINRGAMQGNALRSALETVTRNVEKMVGLINNLLVLYEMHLISPEYTDLNLEELVREAMREARLMTDEQTSPVEVIKEPNLPAVRGDRNGLLLVIRSLIENAFKFSQDNSPVIVNLYLADGHSIGVDVIDQGIGVPPELQDHIFEPFYRVEGVGASRLYSGLGVGQAITKFIVEQHQGQISVESQPGVGSTFTILLPLS